MPLPSIIVNSGNGVHLYWMLDQPYLIDDVGDPPAVENEWIKLPDGRKKPPRKYILENGEKVYLDARRHVSRLCDHHALTNPDSAIRPRNRSPPTNLP